MAPHSHQGVKMAANQSILDDLTPVEKAARIRRMGVSVLQQIGNTPLIRLERVGAEFPEVEFYGKAEWHNPGGSVKDRPALNMIREGERSGALRPGKPILDATSGNTGLAYGMLGASKGYPSHTTPPRNTSPSPNRIP